MPPYDHYRLAGVMGWPIAHSRSPLLHNYWFETYGLAGRYVPFAIAPDRLQPALRALPALGFAGCNLTIPHKERALSLLDDVDATARKIGAVSCVRVRADGTLSGTNYDAFGFIEALAEAWPDWRAEDGPAVIIGAGGGARAVVWALAQRGAKEIRVVNRSAARARALAEAFGAPLRAAPWEQRHNALADAALLVNTTSQGMVGQAPLDLDLRDLPRRAGVADIVYAPLTTPLLAMARARGNRICDGLGMLLHQARPAWRDWFGVDPKVTPELRAMIAATLAN